MILCSHTSKICATTDVRSLAQSFSQQIHFTYFCGSHPMPPLSSSFCWSCWFQRKWQPPLEVIWHCLVQHFHHSASLRESWKRYSWENLLAQVELSLEPHREPVLCKVPWVQVSCGKCWELLQLHLLEVESASANHQSVPFLSLKLFS